MPRFGAIFDLKPLLTYLSTYSIEQSQS